MSTNESIQKLIENARAYQPFGEASEFGFETRIRAALAEASPSLSEWIARFSWRFSFACLPLFIALAIFLTTQQHGQLPEGISGFVTHWSSYLPLEI